MGHKNALDTADETDSMSVVIEIVVPAEEFTLGRSLQGIDSPQFELERMVPTADAVLRFFWAHDTDYDQLEADEDVVSVRRLDELDDRALFRVQSPASSERLPEVGVVHVGIGTCQRPTRVVRSIQSTATRGDGLGIEDDGPRVVSKSGLAEQIERRFDSILGKWERDDRIVSTITRPLGDSVVDITRIECTGDSTTLPGWNGYLYESHIQSLLHVVINNRTNGTVALVSCTDRYFRRTSSYSDGSSATDPATKGSLRPISAVLNGSHICLNSHSRRASPPSHSASNTELSTANEHPLNESN